MKAKRLLSFLLALVMVVGLLPMATFAAEDVYAVDIRILDIQGNDLSHQWTRIEVDQTIVLRAEVEYSDGSIVSENVQWNQDNSYCGTLSAGSGSLVRFTSENQGTTMIIASYTAEDGSYLETALTLDVYEPAASLRIRDTRDGSYVHNGTMKVDSGERFTLNVLFYQYGAMNHVEDGVTWVSGDSSIIAVDQEYKKFDAISDGITTLTASYEHEDGQVYSATVTIKVGYDKDPRVVILDSQGSECTYSTVDLVYGHTMTLSAEVRNVEEEVISTEVAWSMLNNLDILSIDNGKLTAVNAGVETVVATYYDEYGFEYSAEVYISVDYEVPHVISAINCKVYNQAGEEVTSAMNGEELTVVAQPPLPYDVFFAWVCHGTGKLSDLYEETTTLYMGNSDLTVEACFEKGATEITSVTVTGIDTPIVGEEADFTAEVPADAHYTVAAPEGTLDYYNGIYWYDMTDKVALKPGDVFISGHNYTCYVGILPADGYVLSVTETGTSNLSADVELYSSNGGIVLVGMFADVPRYEYVRLVGAFPSLGSSTYLTWYTTPVETYQLNVTGGYALNEDGEVVTRAAAGEKISLFYDDPMGIRDFSYWQNNSSVEVIFEYDSNGNATFTMPESDVDIQAVFRPYPLEKVEFELNGFYAGGQAEGLDVINNNTGVDLIYNDTDKNYTLYNDYFDDMGTVASGYLYSNVAYWLQLDLLVADGYTMDQLMEDAITLKIGNQVYCATSVSHADSYVTVYFKLESVPTVTLYNIMVGDGTALYNGVQVTDVPAGSKIYLTPNNTLEGQTFNGWKDEYGNITIETDVDGMMYFIMPEGNVYVNMLTKGTIYYVYVEGIDYPTVGTNPDFTATVDSDYGYDFYPMDGVTDTGICWHKELDQYSSERLFADSVFEPGCTYTVSAVLQALDGYYFATDEYGSVNALCYINGMQAEISYINDELNKYISIYIKYTLPQSYSITVEGGLAYSPRSDATTENTTPITSATAGEYIKVVATPEDNQIFYHWEIVSGTIKIGEDELLNSTIYFSMPEEDVVIRAVYLAIPTLSLQYPTLSFEDEILYNAYFTVDNATGIEEMGMITFASRMADGTIDDALEILPGYYTSGSSYIVSSNGVPAKNLSDALYFKVYAKLIDGSYVYSDIAGYHAVAYANSILNNAATTAKAKALVVAMLNYGAAAQVYFGYKTDSLMNAGLTAAQQALVQAYDPSMVQNVVKADSNKAGSFVLNGGYSNIWPTVSFEGAFSINYYFTPNQPLTNVATLSFADTSSRTVFETRQQVWEANGIKLTNDKAASTTNMGDHANPVRFYKGSNLTIESPNMTELVVVCPSSAYAQVWVDSNTDSNATVSVEKQTAGYVVTITFAVPTDSFTLTNLTAQTRVSQLKVTASGSAPVMYYWDAETYASVDVLTAENATGVITMTQDGSNWYAAVEGIAAKAIDETVYVAGFYTSNGVAYPTGIISYSLGNYCKSIAANGEAFGAATAVYGYYAKAYFA
ncbi:MAG: hypothetical protein E7466_05860 [Ruminococcaceae bacterium]|nr:hypothetical protein [Oscillospiraceae bacterium]